MCGHLLTPLYHILECHQRLWTHVKNGMAIVKVGYDLIRCRNSWWIARDTCLYLSKHVQIQPILTTVHPASVVY